MELKKFEVGPFAENSYLLTSGDDALLIDPGFSNDSEFKRFRSAFANTGASLKGVLLTHAHIDHVLGLPAVLDAYDVDVYLNHTDLTPWNNIEQQAAMFGLSASSLDFKPKPLPAGDSFEVASFSMDIRYTPGHAPDHVSLYFADDNMVIAGDTLFKGSVGRTDLYKGDSALLKKSILNELYSLPDDTIVYPGHGPQTTIGAEKRSNPFVRV
jgi:glyoxylase-like metal-dependent hydrolase (beta-lactamase superfamily II)